MPASPASTCSTSSRWGRRCRSRYAGGAERGVVGLTRGRRAGTSARMTFNAPVVVERINGVTLRGLGDVVTACAGNKEQFHRLECEGTAGIEALDRAKAEAGPPQILRQCAIPRDRSL